MNDLENKEKELLLNYELLHINYSNRICVKCIGTDKQVERKCGLLFGINKPTCKKMESWIDKKQKKEEKELIQGLLTNLQQPTSERDQLLSFVD